MTYTAYAPLALHNQKGAADSNQQLLFDCLRTKTVLIVHKRQEDPLRLGGLLRAGQRCSWHMRIFRRTASGCGTALNCASASAGSGSGEAGACSALAWRPDNLAAMLGAPLIVPPALFVISLPTERA